MPQNPFQADQFQVDPSSGDTLTITRDTTDGSLKFVDALVTGGVTLSSMIGMQSLSNVFVVGNSLVGASHLTITSALADVPADASMANPYVIFVTSGVYQEDIAIEKDGIVIIGLGYVLIESATVTDTITIQENTTIPTFTVLKDLYIKNTNASQSCVRVVGGATSTVASNTISLIGCNFLAGASGYPVRTASVGKIAIKGGSMKSSDPSAFCLVEETAEMFITNVSDMTALQLDYDNTGVLSSVVGCSYRILDCNFNSSNTVTNSISSTLSGLGSLFLSNVSDCGNLSLDGDRTTTAINSVVQNITTSSTANVILTDCKRGTLSGTGTLSESKSYGTLTFLASASETYSFGIDQPDLNYIVLIENDRGTAETDVAYVSAKTLGNVTISFSGAVNKSVSFLILRDV